MWLCVIALLVRSVARREILPQKIVRGSHRSVERINELRSGNSKRLGMSRVQ